MYLFTVSLGRGVFNLSKRDPVQSTVCSSTVLNAVWLTSGPVQGEEDTVLRFGSSPGTGEGQKNKIEFEKYRQWLQWILLC